jgi:hypothetical protein
VSVERDLLVVACAVSAGVHVALAPEHAAEGAAAAVAFLVSAAALAVLAVVLTRRPRPAAIAAAGLLLAGLIGSWALAVTTGLPLLHPHPEAVEAVAVLTKAVELVGLLAAVRLVRDRPPLASGRPIPLGLTALIACFSGLAALAVASGHHAHVHTAAALLG